MENNSKGLKGILWVILILLALIVIMYAVRNFIPMGRINGGSPVRSENKIDSILYFKIDSMSSSRITILRKSGIPAIIKFEYTGDTKVNEGSSLTREWVVLNDASCPVQLANSCGIKTDYRDRSLRFTPIGNIETSEPITAYEVHHVLYDVFGEHLVTLSNMEIADVNGSFVMKKDRSWYATDNQISEYISCISYVANVKTKAGIIWRYNYLAIKHELNKIQIAYEENYRPSNETDKK